MALLWGKENGYWKIVSWATGVDDARVPVVAEDMKVTRVKADAARRRGARGAIPDPLPLEYGKAFGLTVGFGTGAGDAPVLRMLWRNENGAWRIRSYDLELP